MSELEDAWDAVHEALPAGWRVNRPEYHVETRQWHVFAADHRPGRKRPDYIESVGCGRRRRDRRRRRRAEGSARA